MKSRYFYACGAILGVTCFVTSRKVPFKNCATKATLEILKVCHIQISINLL